MHSSRITGPLSPPSSPRMSGHEFKTDDPLWNNRAPSIPSIYSGYKPSPPGASPYSSSPYQFGDNQQQRHQLQYNRTAGDSSLGVGSVTPATSVNEKTQTPRTEAQNHATSVIYPERAVDDRSHHMPGLTGESQVQSPGDQNADSPEDGNRSEEDDDDGEDDESPDQSKEDEKPPMTAAEIRNQKRKMKRFRLTHNQTRFLMSEFARQAHPDAAHRERLSREIPGLSPRQVQVWFQNRRAKLKRLTAEDRDRMMRSRALPESFGMSMSMNNNNAYGSSGEGAPAIAPEGNAAAALQRPGQMRPLTVDTFQRPGDRNYMNPSGVTPALGSLAFTPPQSATDTHSPISTTGEMGAYGFSQRGLLGSPRVGAFSLSNSAPAYQTQFSQGAGRMPPYDGLRRPSGGSINSPLRTSMSYGGFGQGLSSTQDARSGNGQNQERSGVQNQRDMSREMPPPQSGPYGLGFSYDSMASFQQPHQQPNALTTGQPPRIGHSPHATQAPYRSPNPSVSSQSGQFPPYMAYSNSAYTSPQLPHYPTSYGGAYTSPLQPSGFGPHPGNGQIPPMQNPHGYGQMGASEASKSKETEGEESDGGVAVPTSY